MIAITIRAVHRLTTGFQDKTNQARMTFQIAACFLAALIMAVSANSTGNTDLLKSSSGIFSSKFYNAVNNGHENLLISPLSLNYALTACSLGTDGNTLKELRTLLNHPDDQNAIVSSYKAFTDSLKDDKNLTVATKMYVAEKFQVKEAFKNELTNNFDAEIQNLDFASKPEESRVTINKYVENKTNNLIKDLFIEGSISKDTASVIVNAVYFKSAWLHPFSDELTQKKSFYGINNEEHQVDMMTLPETFLNYGFDKELNSELLELPYKGDYSFCIILPKNGTKITEVENKLKEKATNGNSSPFIDVFKSTSSENVKVLLPKFKFEQTHNLRSVLEEMGLKDLFTEKANFQKLSDAKVMVSDVIQKTYIDVNEADTEAAAATGIEQVPLSIRQTRVFQAIHPFIYLIEHKSSQTPLIIGRFTQP